MSARARPTPCERAALAPQVLLGGDEGGRRGKEFLRHRPVSRGARGSWVVSLLHHWLLGWVLGFSGPALGSSGPCVPGLGRGSLAHWALGSHALSRWLTDP